MANVVLVFKEKDGGRLSHLYGMRVKLQPALDARLKSRCRSDFDERSEEP
jgi:hypothetical protein